MNPEFTGKRQCIRCLQWLPSRHWDGDYDYGFCIECIDIILDAAKTFIGQIEDAENQGKTIFFTKH